MLLAPNEQDLKVEYCINLQKYKLVLHIIKTLARAAIKRVFESDYNLFNNFLIIACGARRALSCATAYLLTSAQHTLRAGIVRDDRELFNQIIV